MRYNLSDIERTLLSAYMDGELSTSEASRAEALLASSEEARSYLRELRVVDTLSSNAFTVPGATAAAGGSVAGGFSSKLSAGAIEAAAEKAIVAKAVTVGSWGLAGVIGTAAAVAVGIALSVQTPSPVAKSPVAAIERPHAASVQSAAPSAQPMVNLDTTNLIVPPMTTSDILAFAVHGTLPLDAKRSRFITLETKGKDSLAVQVHNRAPRDIDRALATIDLSQGQLLDSIERVIRTSLIQSKEGIALRADIPALRLGAIRSFEQAAPRMPIQVREQLDRCREQLNTVAPAYGSPSGKVTSLVIDDQIAYCLIPNDGFLTVGDENVVMESSKIVVDFDNESVFAVNQHALRALQSKVRVQVPIPPPPITAFTAEAQHHVGAGNVMVERQKKKNRQPAMNGTPVSASQAGTPQQNAIVPNSKNVVIERSRNHPDLRVVITKTDTLLIRADEALREAEEHMERVDSLMKQLRKKLERQIHEEMEKRDDDPKGRKEDDNFGTGSASGGGK